MTAGRVRISILFSLLLVGLIPLTVHAQVGTVEALHDSARVRLERGDAAGARTLFEQVLQIEPEHLDALMGLGRAFIELPRGMDDAVNTFQRAMRLAPEDPQVHYHIGLAYLNAAIGALGGQNQAYARTSFENALLLDPSHPDAAYQLGLLLRDRYEEYPEASRYFRRQIDANPTHTEAGFELLRTLVELGQWREAVTEGERQVQRWPGQPHPYPWLAAAWWKLGRADEAMRVFERYFEVAEARERELYFDLGLVLTPEEKAMLETLEEQGRQTYLDRYWRLRDPDPKVEVNERLLEHYIRVAYARIEFGQAVWPWDERGWFYVRYGEPDRRSARGRPVAWDIIDDDYNWQSQRSELQRQMGLPGTMADRSPFDNPGWDPPMGVDKHLVIEIADSIRFENPQMSIPEIWEMACRMAEQRSLRELAKPAPERWVYESHGIDVRFDDPTHRGRYLVSDDRSRLLVSQMEKRLPVLSPEETRIDRIDPMDLVVTFRGEQGLTVAEYAFALVPDEFGAFRSVTGAYATLDVEVGLYTPGWVPVIDSSQRARRIQTVPQVKIREVELLVDLTRLQAPPGEYLLATYLLDPVSGRRAWTDQTIELPDYRGSGLLISDILPAALVRPAGPGADPRFIRGEYEVIPMPARAIQVDQPLYIYYEVYNLTRDGIGSTSWQIRYSVAEAPEDVSLAGRIYQGMRSLVGRGQRRAVFASTVEGSGINPELKTWLELDVSMLPPGIYELQLEAHDQVSDRTVGTRLLFRTLPPPTRRGP